MGCDYYIHKYLKIEHISGTYYYLLNRERKYYLLGNSDNEYDNDYKKNIFDKLYEKYKLFLLKSCKSKIIYKNKKYKKNRYKNKYEKIILLILYNLKYEIEFIENNYQLNINNNLLEELKDIPLQFLNGINEKILFNNLISIIKIEQKYDSYLDYDYVVI
jgi:hypothetical protein